MPDSEKGDDSLLRYLLLFAGLYLTLRLAHSFIYSVISSAYYIPVATILISGGYASHRFVRDKDRPFSALEKRKITFGAFLAALAIDSTFVFREKLIEGNNCGNTFISRQIFNLFVLWTVFGPMTRYLFERDRRSDQ